MHRFKLVLLLTAVFVSMTVIAQSAPEPTPNSDAAPNIAPAAAPSAPAEPASARGSRDALPAKPATNASPAKPEAPRPLETRAEPRAFQLDFTVAEVDGGKVVNTRQYKMLLQIQSPSEEARQPQRASIRNGTRVPVTMAASQQVFIDVGVFIDVEHAVDLGNRLSMNVSGEISSPLAVLDGKATGTPVIHQTRFSSRVLVPFGKRILVYSSDDTSSTRRLDVELNAIPVDSTTTASENVDRKHR